MIHYLPTRQEIEMSAHADLGNVPSDYRKSLRDTVAAFLEVCDQSLGKERAERYADLIDAMRAHIESQ